jgi:APA family basic amino acid/polyamine antiporter
MIAGLIVAAATVALSFASYLGYFLEVGSRPAAFALLTVVCALAVSGIKQSARVIMGLSLIQIGGLVLVVTIGAPHIGEVNLLSGPGMGGILGGAALVFFAFIGFDEVITLAEETRDPTRTVPRALLLALGVSSLLYIAVAVAAVSVLGAAALGASPRPLTDVIAHALGQRSAGLVSAIAMTSTANTTLLALTAASRLLYGMATKEALPGWLRVVHTRTRVPVRGVLCAGAGAAVFASIGDLALIAAVTDFAVYFVFVAINLTVILLRWKRPKFPRPFAVPWSLGRIPMLPILALLSVLIMISRLDLRAIWMGLGLPMMGLLLAVLRVRREGREPGEA